MIHTPPETIPVRADEHGVMRVAGTRVSLDSLVFAFQDGSSPESIAEQFDVRTLADIYLIPGFYLRHRAEVDEYLLEQQRSGEALRLEWEQKCPSAGLRQRLLDRKRPQSA